MTRNLMPVVAFLELLHIPPGWRRGAPYASTSKSILIRPSRRCCISLKRHIQILARNSGQHPMAANRWECLGAMVCSSSSFRVRTKASPKLRQEVKRASQEGHMAPDRLAAGQTADGLVDYCLEDGGGQVFLGGALVDQGLDVGFGEHAAAGGDGVDAPCNSWHTR